MADIDKVKKSLIVVINIAEGIDAAFEDGKLSLSEALAIGVSAVPGGAAVWAARAELIEELKDLDAAEVAELEAFIATEFDIRNDAAELVVEKAISFVVSGIELGLALKELKKE